MGFKVVFGQAEKVHFRIPAEEERDRVFGGGTVG
jgi:hypothetical protein